MLIEYVSLKIYNAAECPFITGTLCEGGFRALTLKHGGTMLTELKSSIIQVGIKQSSKAVTDDLVKKAFVALDAEKRITAPFIELCTFHGVPVRYVDTMTELGHACGVDVGSAVAVILKDHS